MRRYKSCISESCEGCPRAKGTLDCHSIPAAKPPLLRYAIGYPTAQAEPDKLSRLKESGDFPEREIEQAIFSNELVSARKATGMTIEETIEKLDILRTTYEKWEHGYRLPTKYVQKSIIEAINGAKST